MASIFENITVDTDYYATYTQVIKFTVTWKDWDGSVLKTEKVRKGANATPPTTPTRDGGYVFSSWSISGDNVNSDLEIIAQYTEDITGKFKVTWTIDGKIIKTQYVNPGEAAEYPGYKKDIVPNVPEGKQFYNWDTIYSTTPIHGLLSSVKENLNVRATLRDSGVFMIFLDGDYLFYVFQFDNSRTENNQQLRFNSSTPGVFSYLKGSKVFKGWDRKFNYIKISKTMEYQAVWEELQDKDIRLERRYFGDAITYYDIDDTLIDYTKLIRLDGEDVSYTASEPFFSDGSVYSDSNYMYLQPYYKTIDPATGNTYMHTTDEDVYKSILSTPSVVLEIKKYDKGFYCVKPSQITSTYILVKFNDVTAKFKYVCRNNPELVLLPDMPYYTYQIPLEKKNAITVERYSHVSSFKIAVLEETGLKEFPYAAFLGTATTTLNMSNVRINGIKIGDYGTSGKTNKLISDRNNPYFYVNSKCLFLPNYNVLTCSLDEADLPSRYKSYTVGAFDINVADDWVPWEYQLTSSTSMSSTGERVISSKTEAYTDDSVDIFASVDFSKVTNPSNLAIGVSYGTESRGEWLINTWIKGTIADEECANDIDIFARINTLMHHAHYDYTNNKVLNNTLLLRVTWIGFNNVKLKEEFYKVGDAFNVFMPEDVPGYTFVGWYPKGDRYPLEKTVDRYTSKIEAIYVEDSELDL